MYHATGSGSAHPQAEPSYPLPAPGPSYSQMAPSYQNQRIAPDFWSVLNAPQQDLSATFNPEDQRRVENLRADLISQHPFLLTDVQGAEFVSLFPDMGPSLAQDVVMANSGPEHLPGEDNIFTFGADTASPFAFPQPWSYRVHPPNPRASVNPGPPLRNTGLPPVLIPGPNYPGPLLSPTAFPANQGASGSLLVPSASVPEGSIATPIPSRSSTPPLSEPILGVSTDFLRLNHIISQAKSGSPTTPDSPLTVVPPENWLPPPMSTEHIAPTVPDNLVEEHAEALLRTTPRAKLVGVGATYNDIDAGSEFILMNPPDPLVQPLDELFNSTWQDVMARPIGALLANDARLVSNKREAKTDLANHLRGTFSFAFDVLLGTKDSQLLQIKQEANPDRAVDRINLCGTQMYYAHLACFVKANAEPVPITIYTRPQVADFKQEVRILS
ncbi:hypothetical protein FA13DRAFT_1720108 [Coprinellus micaceus]|uniref:Uncharacterized protein n=1 Tax=Coprinellus micaceus TaxID=71717 RepID=A0A4Y7SAN7_COPMI|nr:hypothetical protein FA13DRAFT_1720108 [Coprinellus micaceus]